jgi:hypothetical protein
VLSLEVPRLDDLRNMKPEYHAVNCVVAARKLWD